MKLLNEVVLNSIEFKQIKLNILQIEKDNSKLSYYEFKENLSSFILLVMKTYLANAGLNRDNYSFIIDKLPFSTFGLYSESDNKITINEKIVKQIYSGKINLIQIIFHELTHFKIAIDKKVGYSNEWVVRCIKEEIISNVCLSNELNRAVIENESYFEGVFCNPSYEFTSEETIADIQGNKYLLLFLEYIGINLKPSILKKIKTSLEKNLNDYNNHKTKFQLMNLIIPPSFSFDNIFDSIIINMPELLIKYPQLKFEYYISDGCVLKKSKDMLFEDLMNAKDENDKEYIKFLLQTKTQSNLKK